MFHPNEKGFYGAYGGAYIPEMLIPNIEELRGKYLRILESDSFQKTYHHLLSDSAGRPSPLLTAERMSQRYQTNNWLKREDLNHTGSHKPSSAIAQILPA